MSNELIIDVWVKPARPITYITIPIGPFTEEELPKVLAALKEIEEEHLLLGLELAGTYEA